MEDEQEVRSRRIAHADCCGQIGKRTTRPSNSSSCHLKSLGDIYKGNCSDRQALADKYIKDYDQYLFKMPEAVVENIAGEDVKATCNEAKHTAVGMDQWAPADLKELSDSAYQHLADMMNTIEKCAPWFEALLSARAAFLAKDANGALNPLAYGVLLMLPSINRTCAKIRLEHLKP